LRDLVGRDPEAERLRVEPVELAGELGQGAVAARDYVGDDGADRRIDVRGAFPLGGEKRLEPIGKIGGAGIEADRHRLVMPGIDPGIYRKIVPISKRWIAGSAWQ